MSRAVHLLPLLVALAVGPARAADPAAEAGGSYRILVDGSSTSLPVGGKGKAVVFVEPLAKGVHVNREFPLRIKVETSPGLRAERPELRRADAVDPAADNPRFEVGVSAVQRGAQQVTLQMRFAICSDTWCVPQQRTVSVPIEVR